MAKRRRIPNDTISDMLTGKSGIDALKNLSDNRSIGKIDYVAMQLSQPSLVFKELITDEEKLMITDRHEEFNKALWSEEDIRLTKIFTSSLQSNETKIYYRNVYKTNDADLGPEFTISYGDYYGYGSSTGSFGNISTNVYESKAIYSKYQNLLLGSDKEFFKFNFPSWSNVISSGARILSAGKSISTNLTTYNSEQQLYFVSNFPLSNWKSVSSGYTFTTALKQDGTLWSWGSNGNGELGIGTTENSNVPVQIGTDSDWVFHTSGAFHSFAIKSNGTLWTWGKGSDYRLGTGANTNVLSPVQITLPFPKIWKYAAAGQGHSIAVDSDGKLWGWGYNSSGQLGTGDTSNKTIPTQIGSDTDWATVYASIEYSGDCFSLALKENGELYGMGFNENYQLGLNNSLSPITNPTRVTRTGQNDLYVKASAGGKSSIALDFNSNLWNWGTFNSAIWPSASIFSVAGSNWIDVKISAYNAIGLKSNGSVYTWGENDFGSLGNGSTDSYLNSPKSIIINPILEEDKKVDVRNILAIETSDYDTFGSFSTIVSKYDFDEKEYQESDFIYVINVNRNRFKDNIKPGTWQLSLLPVDVYNRPITGSIPITLIDDSSLYNYDVDKKDVYNVYSGSLEDGFNMSEYSVPYGLFYPNHGIIVLNGRSLYSFASIFTNRSLPTASGQFEYSSNADTLFTSISASMDYDSSKYYFQGMSSERIESSYIFVRIKSDEFNYTNNPTYVTGDNGRINPKYRNNDFGLTYITTIGLYDDEENLVAVAKLSRPIRKTIEKEMVIKIRIRY